MKHILWYLALLVLCNIAFGLHESYKLYFLVTRSTNLKFPLFYIEIPGANTHTKHRYSLQREDIHRYDLSGPIVPSNYSDEFYLKYDLPYHWVALNHTRLVKGENSNHVYLLWRGLRRYISRLDADALIAEALGTTASQLPIRIEAISDQELLQYPLGRLFNELSFGFVPEDSSAMIIENRQLQFYKTAFNPSAAAVTLSSKGKQTGPPRSFTLFTNRERSSRGYRVTELYQAESLRSAITMKDRAYLQLRWKHKGKLYIDFHKNCEDMRMFTTAQGKLYMVSTNNYRANIVMPDRWAPRRRYFMTLARIHVSSRSVYIGANNLLLFDATAMTSSHQKNWIPFEHAHTLRLIYSINPHIILNYTYPLTQQEKSFSARNQTLIKIDLSLNKHLAFKTSLRATLAPNVLPVSAAFSTAFNDSFWTDKYGQLRGGTPAVLYNASFYLSIFHSSIYRQVGDSSWHIYAMGAYLFDASPPFRVRAMSSAPIGQDRFYAGPPSKLYRELSYCVFPMNLILGEDKQDKNVAKIVYGRNNEESWVASLRLDVLIDSLLVLPT